MDTFAKDLREMGIIEVERFAAFGRDEVTKQQAFAEIERRELTAQAEQ